MFFIQEDLFLDIGESKIILVLGQLLSLPVFHLSVDIQYTHGGSSTFENMQRHIARS